MRWDKIKLYVLQILLIVSLILMLVFGISNKYLLVLLLGIFAIIIKFTINKPIQVDIKTKKVLKLLILLAFLYVGIYYTIGIYSGFYKAFYKFGLTTLYKYIIPISLIIIISEYIRSKFISVETKVSMVFNFIICVLIDILVYSNIYGINSLNEFLVSVGYISFASISNNLLFNYLSKRYGYKVIIIYRLITALYLYIIPITPDVYIFLRSFLRMLYPLIIYYIVEDTYGNKKNSLIIKKDNKTNVVSVISFTIMIIFIGLISCEFRYGALVIGSSSMKGTINKGDVIVFDSDNEVVKEGDVLVFNKKDTTIVHRVKKIEYKNDKLVYYTKGDNNLSDDEGYITDEDIKGKVKVVIPYVGQPTLWINDIFSKGRERGEI